MSAAVRAGVSVLLLAGFYLVGLLQLAAVVALVWWLSSMVSGLAAVKIVWPLFAAIIGGAGVAVWRVLRAKPEPPRGLAVGPTAAPDLWATVNALAREVGTRPPDEIRLISEVNAAVTEHPRLLGLIGGRRFLYIGLPLLQTFTVDQLRSVLAHELGHYSRKHVRLGAVAYRGRLTIAVTLSRIEPYNLAGLVFEGYGRLYLLVDSAVTRRQEHEADQASVRIAGRDAAISALRELPVLDAAMDFYVENYVEPGWEAGYAPADFFGGFSAMVAAREDELAKLRAQEPTGQGSRWDTHPALPDRIAAISAAPEEQTLPDGRSATVLVPDIAEAGLQLQALMIDTGERPVLPWEEFTDAMLTAQMQRSVDQTFRTLGRRTGITDLGTVFELVAQGRLTEVAEALFPDATRREAGPRCAEVVAHMLRLAALRSGRVRWRHSWSGPAQFDSPDGAPLPLEEIAALAVTPDGLPEALRRLAELGIDPARAALVARTDDAVGAAILGAMANVRVKRDDTRREYDLLVLTKGFVFVANPGRANKGKRRLEQLVQSGSPTELAERYWFLPYEEVATAVVIRELPLRATLKLHDGSALVLHERLSSELITRDTHDTLLDVLRRVGEG